MPRQPASRARRGNSVADVGTDHAPSTVTPSIGSSVPTLFTERSPHDTRARGPESELRPTFKSPIAPLPLRHKGDSRADDGAALASTTALRDSDRSHGSDAVSSQTNHPPRPSAPRNDSLESRNVSSEMTQPLGVASSLRRGGTRPLPLMEHKYPVSRQPTTLPCMDKPRTSTSANNTCSREHDATIRQSTQHSRAIPSLPRGVTPGSDSTRVHIQGSENSFGFRFDELDCVSSRATETPSTPERQSYERTRDDPSKEVFITDDEPLSKGVDASCDSHSPTMPKQATDQQSSNGSYNQELPDAPNDELQEVELDDLTTEDIIIAIMGPTGAGKSSFVAKATNRGNEGVVHALLSHTSEIKATKCIIGGSNVVLVDTPGFDDTKKSDLQILESISDWLNKSDNRMAGTPLKNLRVFQKLCGNKAMSQVILVTTMWDEVEESVGNERLEELEGNYWKMMIAQGSTTYRYMNTLESSRQLLSQLVERKRREVRLQKQIADKNLELRETDAGWELYSRLDQIAEKRAEILARITAQRHQAGGQATAEDLRKQYESLKTELDQTLQQMQSLKLTSVKRAAANLSFLFNSDPMSNSRRVRGDLGPGSTFKPIASIYINPHL
ncbi:hypothetical protein EDD16DRAFT_1712153 [Pisolithus croceorrhizus]|nr:hypothetical protein EDD16DRAFT_1712153 [Pisolithus croceorrhizus]KAI6111693.1 hypothetical protein EV401DRAFT_2075297 [Pisolithus croceorrhizus]